MNGQAEAGNKVVLKGIKKSLDGAKGAWVDELPGILWIARIIVKGATSYSPFHLVYGSEVVLPVQVGIRSRQVIFYDYAENEQEKPINLNLLPEIRGKSRLWSIQYKERVTR